MAETKWAGLRGREVGASLEGRGMMIEGPWTPRVQGRLGSAFLETKRCQYACLIQVLRPHAFH